MSWRNKARAARDYRAAYERVKHARTVGDLPEGRMGAVGVRPIGWRLGMPAAVRPLCFGVQPKSPLWSPSLVVRHSGYSRIVARMGNVYVLVNVFGCCRSRLPADTPVETWCYED